MKDLKEKYNLDINNPLKRNVCTVTMKTVVKKQQLSEKANYKIVEETEREITHYDYCSFIKDTDYFKSLGFEETIIMDNTDIGFVPTKLISVSPDKKEKIEITFIINKKEKVKESLIEVDKKERDMENLQSIYNTWKKEGIELAEQTGLGFVWDCGESIAREDFSNYAGLEKEITFEEMLALENEEWADKIEMLKEVKDIPNRIGFTVRKDGFIVSTIRSLDNWYGKYETAITHKEYFSEWQDSYVWRIAEGYKTRKEAIKGHKKYVNMTADEINNIEFIG